MQHRRPWLLNARLAPDGEDPIDGCQIGALCPIMHAKMEQVYPIGQ
jgi:hypothetical protein